MYPQHQNTDIEILEEILKSLRVTKEYTSDKNRITKPEIPKNISTVSAPVLVTMEQAVTLKSIVPELG